MCVFNCFIVLLVRFYVQPVKQHVCVFNCLLVRFYVQPVKQHVCVFNCFITYMFQSSKVHFNNIPEGHIPMWIYIMYAGMSTGKYNDK